MTLSCQNPFWSYALETAVYLLNRVPSKSVDKTPYEMWCNKKPVLALIKIWGCPAYVKHIVSDKLEAKSDKCLFVGYPKETKGYYFYHASEQKAFVSRHSTFLEKEFLLTESSRIELDEVQDPQMEADDPIKPMTAEVADSVVDPPVEQTPRRPVRVRTNLLGMDS